MALIARDLVDHFERRLEVMDGKAMVVAMSRRIAMDLYDAIVALRPEWHAEDDEQGVIKVVMTGNASEGPRVAMHSRNKARREALANRFRDPDDALRVVIVRDMWLTGFDAPCLHTMYADKPMQGHGLMQAIARVTASSATSLGDWSLITSASRTASSGRWPRTRRPAAPAARRSIRWKPSRRSGVSTRSARRSSHGFNRANWRDGSPAERLSLIPAAQEHILSLDDGKDRLRNAVAASLQGTPSRSRTSTRFRSVTMSPSSRSCGTPSRRRRPAMVPRTRR